MPCIFEGCVGQTGEGTHRSAPQNELVVAFLIETVHDTAFVSMKYTDIFVLFSAISAAWALTFAAAAEIETAQCHLPWQKIDELTSFEDVGTKAVEVDEAYIWFFVVVVDEHHV